MNNTFFITTLFFCYSLFGQDTSKAEINELLNSWHKAAAEANFEAYFSKMTPDAIFIGTDATENWNAKEFEEYSKPYFDRGKAWTFRVLERNIYLSEDKKTAWFDELLDTQMKLCRGSGVLKNVNGQWKIAHYVLSIVVPNKNVDQLVKIKEKSDSLLILKLKNPQ